MGKAQTRSVEGTSAYAALGTKAVLLDGKADTGAGDYVDLAGAVSKVVVELVNGITNAAAVKLQGAFDPLDGSTFDDVTATWYDLETRSGPSGTWSATPVALTAGLATFVTLPGTDIPRYVRANVTDANALGVSAQLYAER